MDYAFRAGAEALVFGQTADDFKVRLGCNQERRFFYVAAASLVGSLILKAAGEFLLPEPPRPATHHVFRDPDSLRDPNRMTNFGTSFDVEMGVARKDRTHGQTLTTR